MIKDFVFRQKFDKYEILSDKYEIGNMKFVLPSGFGKAPLTKRLSSPPLILIIITLLSTNRQLLIHIQTSFGILRGKKKGFESDSLRANKAFLGLLVIL